MPSNMVARAHALVKVIVHMHWPNSGMVKPLTSETGQVQPNALHQLVVV